MRQVSVKPCRQDERRPGAAAVRGGEGELVDNCALLQGLTAGFAQDSRQSARGRWVEWRTVAAASLSDRMGGVAGGGRGRRRPLRARARPTLVQPHSDSARTVSRCARDGSLIQSEELAVLELDGVAVEKPLSVTRPTRGGGRLQIVYEYGSATDGGAAEAAPARAAAAEDSCSNSEFRFNGSPPYIPWAVRGYTYFANLARMPHRDRRPPADHEGQAFLGPHAQQLRVQ